VHVVPDATRGFVYLVDEPDTASVTNYIALSSS
jgi:hypothetical protein